jgi:hypothetical protein
MGKTIQYAFRYVKDREAGLTEQVREALRKSKRAMTVRELVENVPALADQTYGHQMAHAILGRLVMAGEIRRERI